MKPGEVVTRVAAALELDPERLRDPKVRERPEVRGREVAAYILTEWCGVTDAFAAVQLGFSQGSTAKQSARSAGAAIARGDRWYLEALDKVGKAGSGQLAVGSVDAGEGDEARVRELVRRLIELRTERMRTERELRGLVGKAELQAGFPVKLGGMKHRVQERMYLSEGVRGELREFYLVGVEADNEGLVTGDGGQVTGDGVLAAGELPKVEVG